MNVVLFPEMQLPLHIFEPRYKQMIAHCMAERAEFGVVLAGGEGIAQTGCTAEIQRMVRKYDDGRMDILTIGRLVFRISEVLQEQAYLEALVDLLPPQPAEPTAEERAMLQSLFAECFALLHGTMHRPGGLTAGQDLAFFAAQHLPFDLEFRQRLLECAANERAAAVIRQMEMLRPLLARVHGLRTTAGGNGHARNG